MRGAVITFLALICGGAAAYGVSEYIKSNKQTAIAPVVEKTDVLIAIQPIERGVMVIEEYLAIKQWPKDMVPGGAATKLEEVVGKTARVSIGIEEPIFKRNILEGRGLAALTPIGMRSFTISTPSRSSTVAGFLIPGNKVDIILNVAGGPEVVTTTTLLQAVEILATEQLLEGRSDNKMSSNEMQSVTLLVTPEQCQILTLAQHKGTLALSLRNDEDRTNADVTMLTYDDVRRLLGFVMPEPEEVVERRVEAPEVEPEPAVESLPDPVIDLSVAVRTIRGRQVGEVIINRKKDPSSMSAN